MGAPLLTVASTVMCSHGGQVQFISSNTRVKAGGAFVVTQADTTVIAGCPFTTPPAIPTPCIMAQWVVAATRVKIMGTPVLNQSSQALTTGMGPPVPLQIIQTQTKASAT